jgi:hypothetical protein
MRSCVPRPMNYCYTSAREMTSRDRFDTSATSLTNSMIRMPHKHHCLSLVSNDEARMREFDSRLASRCLPLNRGEQTHPIASRWYRLSFCYLRPPSFAFSRSSCLHSFFIRDQQHIGGFVYAIQHLEQHSLAVKSLHTLRAVPEGRQPHVP